MKRFLILGAGLSGLALAWFLQRRFGERIDLKLLPCRDHVDEELVTDNRHGFIFEQGDPFLGSAGLSRNALKILDELGLTGDLLSSNARFHEKYVLRGQGIKKIRGRLFWRIFSLIASGNKVVEAKSVYDYCLNRYGRGFANNIATPYFRSFPGGDIRKRSFSNDREPFDEIFPRCSLYTLRGGMATLMEELTFRLNSLFLAEKEIVALRFAPEAVELLFTDGSSWSADHVFAAVGAPLLAKLFAPLHRGLARLFAAIPCKKLGVLNLGYHKSFMKKRATAFYFSGEEEHILALSVDSNIFPQQNILPEETRLRILVDSEKIGQKAVADYVLAKLPKRLRLDSRPHALLYSERNYPLYSMGHEERIEEMNKILKRVFARFSVLGRSFSDLDVNRQIDQCKDIEESVFL